MKHETKIHLFITILGIIFLVIGDGTIISMAGGLCILIFPIKWINDSLEEKNNVH